MEIDESFLAEVGMADMPEEQKAEFLRRTKSELELRVGEEISKGLSPEQIKEFEALSDGDQRVIKKLVFEMDSDFREDKIYQAILKQSGKETGDWQVLSEYLSVRWIQKNRPDYKEVVNRVTEKLKEEIRASRG
ncbi:MAG: DUF5663 domain-containing protein [Candidatus Saccharibacteria bacterium]|nr:DUF5663 domain-containing protein [Candidatus Saccharibacteria bacterium]